MSEEKRMAKRIEADEEITLVLCSGSENTVLAGPFQGLLKNVSKSGAGLLVSQVVAEPYHLFYTPRDDSSKILYLQVSFSEEKQLAIPSFPIWMDCDHSIEETPFTMGIEFMTKPGDEQVKELNKLMKEIRKKGDGWLKGLFS